jgi:ornithine--oxo-acid transaminase
MRLFHDKSFFTQICGNNFMVLKVAPALVVQESHLEEFVDAITSLVELMESSASYWTEALGMVGRVLHVI